MLYIQTNGFERTTIIKMNGLADYFCLHRKFLVYNLILRNLKIRYRKSFFGMLWTLLIPAGSAAIYYLVFHFVLHVTVPSYLLFIVSGIIPWTFLTTAIGSSVESIVGNHGLLNKVPLPPQALVLSDNLTAFLNLILSLPIIAVVAAFSPAELGFACLQYLPMLGILFLSCYGLGLILSLSFVYFRDLKYLISLALQFWFYLTPVMYQTKMIPEKFLPLLHLNPVGILFAGFHNSIVLNQWFTAGEWASCLIWCLVINVTAYYLLRKTRYKIVELL